MRTLTFFYLSFFAFLFFHEAFAAEKNTGVLNLPLDEAILLAVRHNPNVQSSRLSYIADKFDLWVQEWEFKPHYFFNASASTNRNMANNGWVGGHNYNVSPSVTLLTPIGTRFKLSATNSKTINYNPGVSFNFIQPLMRGFGRAIVEASLNDARDSMIISRLTIKGTLRSTITSVINVYLSVVAAERAVKIDEDAVKTAKTSVAQTKLFIQAGHMAGNELVTVEANAASAQTFLENDKNNLAQARYALLAVIGLDPNSPIHVPSLNIDKLIHKYHFPTLDNAKKRALENDVQYQTELITLHGQKARNVLSAEDNMRWELNVEANVATGNGNGNGQNAGLNSLFNGVNQAQSIGLTLNIPIDNQRARQALLNARLAIKQANIVLRQDKWKKETDAINGWNNVLSAERALHFAEDAERLQEKTYQVSYQKYLHGLIDSLELQSALSSLIQAKQVLLAARISYLRALVDLDELTGNTLKTWQIDVRL
jgi:outer membrane protein